MENIKDYVGKKQLIQVNNKEEYENLLPLLNTIYRGWTSDNYSHYMRDAKHGCFWIILDRDVMTRTIDSELHDGIIQASIFMEKSEPEIINQYSIY